MNWIQWSIRYIRVLNSCDNGKLCAFYRDIATLPGAFKKKRYIWNVIRGKTFYINAANYVTENVGLVKVSVDLDPNHMMDETTDKLLSDTAIFIRDILQSEQNHRVQRSFVRHIAKNTKLVTLDMLPHLDRDRILKLLNGDWVASDSYLEPLITTISSLRASNDMLTETLGQLE